ncbi:MAG: ATP-binding protein [Erysipelotrichaceae bacterium]|nr:ATP-binding protein [Erysipelotrichaceae bacterium]
MDTYQDIEKSIITKSRKGLWRPFCKALKDYELIKPDEKVMVLISMGKESFLLCKCVEEIIRHGDFGFDAYYVYIDNGDEENLKYVEDMCDVLHVDVKIIKDNEYDYSIDKIIEYGKGLSCTKIALSDIYDDVLEMSMINILYAGKTMTLMPKEYIDDMEIIRPLYLVEDDDIDTWVKRHNLSFKEDSYLRRDYKEERSKMKKLIYEMGKNNPFIRKNIYKTMCNVNLNCILEYIEDDKNISFLDNYKGEE